MKYDSSIWHQTISDLQAILGLSSFIDEFSRPDENFIIYYYFKQTIE